MCAPMSPIRSTASRKDKDNMKKILICSVLTATFALVGCGDDPTPPPNTDVGLEEPTVTTWTQPEIAGPLADVDQSDASAVAEAVTEQVFSWDASRDATSGSAAHEAEPLMDEEFASQNRNSWEARMKLLGSQWQDWAADEAVSTVELTEGKEQRPADTETQAFRQYGVDITMKGKSTEQKIHYDVFVTLEHLGWWRVSDMQISQPQFPTN